MAWQGCQKGNFTEMELVQLQYPYESSEPFPALSPTQRVLDRSRSAPSITSYKESPHNLTYLSGYHACVLTSG